MAYHALVHGNEMDGHATIFAMPNRSDIDPSIEIPDCCTSIFRATEN